MTASGAASRHGTAGDAARQPSGLPPVLYIAGLGRSGTTLLERALGELDGAVPLGEVVHLWHRGVQLGERCGCGQPFHSCPFWTAVGEAAFGGWSELDVERVEQLRTAIDRSRMIPRLASGRMSSALMADLAEYTGYYLAVYAAAAQVSGARVVVDSSKHPSLAYCLRTRRELDLRILHVIRDPRAVAYSWTKRVSRPEATEHDGEWMTQFRPSRTAMLWNGHNLSLRALRRTTTPSMLVRYEDFLVHPADTLRAVAGWSSLCPVQAWPISDDGIATLTAAHTVSGNPGRFTVGEVPVVARDGWQSGLSARQRATVTGLTWPVMRTFGYH
jgi:hypothetical protein